VLTIYEPCVEAHLGDIGFVDKNDGIFHKLFNVADPPDKPGSPPPFKLVKGTPRKEHLDAIHLKTNTAMGATGRVNIPLTSGPTADLEFNFSEVRGRECILIPGTFIVKERLEELGGLMEYMNNHHRWIEKEFARRHDIKLKQIILVVGTLKTDRWAIAVTSDNEVVEHMVFTISSVASATLKLWGHWSKSLSVSRSSCLKDNDNAPSVADQTLFIRRISLRPDIALGKKKWAPSFPPRTLIQRLYATIVDVDEPQK